MRTPLSSLLIVGLVASACAQIIGVSDYEIDTKLGVGGAPAMSSGGDSTQGGDVGAAGGTQAGGEGPRGGAGGEPTGVSGAPVGGAAGGQGGDGAGGGSGGSADLGCGEELLLGGNFDSQRAAWLEYSELDFLPLIVSELDTPSGSVPAQSGSYLAWLGGAHDDLQSLTQPITIPEGATSLVFSGWFQIATVTPADTNADLANASLWDAEAGEIFDIYPVWDPSQEIETWQAFSYSLDVSLAAGKTLDFQLVVGTDAVDNTNFFFDTLSVVAICE